MSHDACDLLRDSSDLKEAKDDVITLYGHAHIVKKFHTIYKEIEFYDSL